MKNYILFITSFLIVAAGCNRGSSGPANKEVENTQDNLVFAVPFAPVSYPVFKMLEDRIFEKQGIKTGLIIWSTPDQLKALFVGNKADFYATASNTAATFYNKGVDIKLINISVWKLLWMVSRNADKKKLADFKGEEIAMPFKGDMPHIVFNELAKAQGLDPEKDFKLVFEPHPMDAAQKLMMRRIDNAVLVDPAASMVLTKSKSGAISVIAPDLHRSFDFQNEWARVFNTKNEIPFAGMVAGGSIINDTLIMKTFAKAYAEASEWCATHPEETAKLVVKYIPQLSEKGITEAMKNVLLKTVDAGNAKNELEQFFSVLIKSNPGLVGGKLPDNGFYY